MRNDFEKAMHFRHACKLFDETKKVSDEDINFIVEAGRMSPSSFGLEHWHFLVISNDDVKAALRPACWNQPQITTCSHFVVLLAKRESFFAKGSPYLDMSFGRRTAGDKEKLETIKGVFDNFTKNELKPSVLDWSKMQCYIASANMMTAAAYIGIDSCPIEGFAYDTFENKLADVVPQFDKSKYAIAYAVCFGYRVNEQPGKHRLPMSEVATFVK